MRASGRRFRPAVAVGERGVVFVLPGFGRVAAQLYDERREVALVRPRGAEVLHDDGFLSRRGAFFFQQPGKSRLALAVQDVSDIERARPIARGHVAEPDVHHAVLPHADGGHGGHAHAARELVLRHAVGRRLVGQREQVGDGKAAYCSVCASPASVVATTGMYTVTPPDVMACPPCKSSVSNRLRCCGDGSEPPTA